MEILYPLLLFGILGTLAAFGLARFLPRSERVWLIRFLLVAFSLRMAAATLFAVVPETRLFHDDANGYELIGMHIARSWQGAAPPLNLDFAEGQNYGFPYVGAAIYYLFGQFRPLLSYFNCVLGTASVLLVYALARQFFHLVVARRAALFAGLMPSMILWSSVAIKDPLMALLILIGLNSCVAIKRRFSVRAVLGIAVALLAMQPIRFYMVYFLGFAIVTSLFLERGMRLVSGVYKQVFTIGVFVGLLALSGFAARAEGGLKLMSLERVSGFRHGMAVSANSGFDADADVSTPTKAILFMPIGLSELLLGPFPWQFGSLRALMAAPETVYWWFLFPSVISGMAWMFRKRFAETSPLLLFATSLTCAYSLVHGNVGSGFRQRAQIFIVLFIFASLGRYRRRCLKLGIDPDALLNDRSPPPVVVPAEAVTA